MFLSLLGACATPAPPPVPAAEAPAWTAPAQPEDDAIYFVLVDRFADGDSANNAGSDRSDPQGWHGGDLQGVIDRLDHIQGLGFTTIWVSPIFRSRQEKFHEWGAFHGYWVEDPRQLEARFGDEETLAALREALEARGMRLILDMVYNHVSFDSPLVDQHPDWFHDEGTIEDWDDAEEVVTHQVHGLPDLAQEREEVYEFLHDSSMRWVQLARPAGVRIDAVRHMPASFLSAISDDLKAEAGPEFVVLGEMFEGDPLKLAETAAVGGFSHVFDFPLHYAMVDVFCKDAPIGRLASTLSADRHYVDPDGLVTFLDNHDLPRVTSACEGDLERVKAALTFQLTTRGTPSVTYGTEIALEGAEEPHNRADMDFDAAQPLAGTIRELLALRSAHPALTDGIIHLSHLDDDLLVYQRWTTAEGAVIAVNRGETERTVALPAHWMGETMSTYSATATRDQRGFTVAPGSVGVALVNSPRPTALLTNNARITVHAKGVEVPEGGSLRLVGPESSFGNWDPLRAPEIPLEPFEIEWSRHEVLEVKLVVVDAAGEVTWQEGVNTYALIDDDRSIVLNW